MLSAKVSTKFQISLPSEARRALGIKAGDRLSVVIRNDELVLRPRPPRASDRLRGLGSEIWRGIDPVAYVREIRHEWDERAQR